MSDSEDRAARGAKRTLLDDSAPSWSDVREIREPSTRVGDEITDRYELIEVLGRGASGVVYDARDLDDGGRPVAVKLLHAHLRASAGHVARFARECRALARIAHSAVVRVLDAGEDRDRTLFLVMERLDGELLHRRIGDGLSGKDTVEIGRQLLGALTATHARGIVHRDIKPENLFLVATDDGTIRLKVLDFGIAKLTQPDGAISFQTLDGLIIGTPEYMSPEVCRGEPASMAADLWASAAVLYHALAGRPPFEEEFVGKLLMRIVTERAPSIATHRPDLTPHIVEAIDRALEPDPADRFATAAQMATALVAAAPVAELDWD